MNAIIVVAYARPKETVRLIQSIKAAHITEGTDLIISIDYSDVQQEIINSMKNFIWEYGELKIIKHDKNLGLKNNVLFCGDLSVNYDAVIVLEDDLVVSNMFYKFAVQVLKKYQEFDMIAGISLYSHHTNIGAKLPFFPKYNGFDTYLMQYAQSWGQVWSQKMWMNFRIWFNKFDIHNFNKKGIPDYILEWDNKSWLKYYLIYIIDKNLFFVYPYFSLTTNYSERGVHSKSFNSNYMVEIQDKINREYYLPDISDSIKYDVYFERVDIIDKIESIYKMNVIVDLYGKKTIRKSNNLLFSTQRLKYKCLNQTGLVLRPHEENLINLNDSKGIYLYDLRYESNKKPETNRSVIYKYFFKDYNWKMTLMHGLNNFIDYFLSGTKNKTYKLFKFFNKLFYKN